MLFVVFLVPPAVSNLHVVRASVAAARLAWQAPDLSACNSFKGYQVYLSKEKNDQFFRSTITCHPTILDDTEVSLVTECGVTIGNLTASSTYQVEVSNLPD
jgi:hypothetical protein